MEALTTVDYNGTTIRVYGTKFSPWFSAEDIAHILRYRIVYDALRFVDAEDKADLTISEFGLYTLIAKKQDIDFKRFVTREMLPQIHKKGNVKQSRSSSAIRKYERLYELASGEKLTKENLSYRAISFGMPKTEAKRNSIVKIVEYINAKEDQKAKKEAFENYRTEYPYTYDYVDDFCSGNLSTLWRLLPEDSHIEYNGECYFNEQALQAIKYEMAKWK